MKQLVKKLLKKSQLEPAALELRRQIRWVTQRQFGYVDNQLIKKYFQDNEIRKFHIGCGRNTIEGWLNADYNPYTTNILCFNACERFPFPDNSFDYIYSEHMIEHISYPDGLFMLSECFRILKPNGKIRIATPDFNFLLKIYQDSEHPLHSQYIDYILDYCMKDAPYQGAIFVINNFVRDWGHLFIYDRKSLQIALEKVGFSRITQCNLQTSEDKHFYNLANEKRFPDGFLDLETMTFEAIKLQTNQDFVL